MTIVINWKTSLTGLALLAWAALDTWHSGHISDADQTAALTGIGLIFAKDGGAK
jgi:hypothetical protein